MLLNYHVYDHIMLFRLHVRSSEAVQTLSQMPRCLSQKLQHMVLAAKRPSSSQWTMRKKGGWRSGVEALGSSSLCTCWSVRRITTMGNLRLLLDQGTASLSRQRGMCTHSAQILRGSLGLGIQKNNANHALLGNVSYVCFAGNYRTIYAQ